MQQKIAGGACGFMISMIVIGAVAGDVVAAERTTLGEFFTQPL